MDYEAFFRTQIDNLKREGRYRVFADLERQAGNFPKAKHYDPSLATSAEVTVWCSQRLSRHGPAPGRAGRHARGARHAAAPAPAAPATSPAPTTTTCCWSASWPTCTARRRRCCSPRATSRTRRRSARWRKLLPGCVDPLRRAEPRLDDRGHPPRRAEKHDLPPQRPGPSRPAAQPRRSDRPKLVAFEIRLFDGRRHRAASPSSATWPRSTAR